MPPHPNNIRKRVRDARAVDGYSPQPALFNKHDPFEFDKPDSNFSAVIYEYTSLGFFDYRLVSEGYDDRYHSMPVSWDVSSSRKKPFFELAIKISGS